MHDAEVRVLPKPSRVSVQQVRQGLRFCGRGLTPLLQRVGGAKAARLVALTVVSMEPPEASPNQEQIEP